jgi:peptidyl-prolyl cis-trans isomerase SurA
MKKAAAAARAVAAAAVVFASSLGPALAQDQQLIEEVVARVNADIITRSQYLEVVQQTQEDIGRQTQDKAEAEKRFAEFKPKILDLMIDNMLIVQKGQDLGIDVEAVVNRQFAAMAKDQNPNMSITEFEELMRQNGLDPNDVRTRLRERLMRDEVMNREVYGAVFRSLTEREKREFYEKNKEKFMQPGELKLSELFLPVEGRSFTEIETKAREVVASARGGAAFADLVKKFGDPTRASYANGGSLGSFKSSQDLAEPLSTAIESLKTGEVTEPLRLKDGVIVLRVDERREPAAKPYEEVANDVALALVYERSQEAERKYLAKLRSEAYIKITPGYETASAKAEAPKDDKQ